MRNFHDTFETCKQSFICTFSVCMTVPFMVFLRVGIEHLLKNAKEPCAYIGFSKSYCWKV